MKNRFASIALTAMLATAPLVTTLTKGEVQSWKMYGGGPRHTFHTTDTARNPLKLDWEYKSGGGFLSQSGASWQKGVYFVPLSGGQLQAIDESTGKTIWTKVFDGERLNARPVPANDYLVVSSQSGKIYVLLSATGQLKWTYDIRSDVSFPPIVIGGIVFAATDEGLLLRLTLRGLYYTGLINLNNPLSAQPTSVAGGQVCIATRDGRVSMYDSGLRPMWHTDIEDYAVGSLCETSCGLNLISKRGMVYCFDRTTGKTNWQLNIGSDCQPGLITDGSFLYTVSMRGNLFSISPDGEVTWKTKIDGDVVSRPVVSAGKIYTGTLSRQVFCHTTSDGTQLWSARVDQSTYSGLTASNKSLLVLPRVGIGYCFSLSNGSRQWSMDTGSSGKIPPITDGENVYAAMNDGTLKSIGMSDGNLNWSKQIGREINSPPAMTGNRIITGTADEYLVCTDTDGKQLWKSYIPYYMSSPPTVAGKYAFIGTWGGEVISIDLNTGTRQWSQATNAEVKSSPSVSQRGVYIGSWDSNLYCFDYQSGTLNWKMATSYNLDHCISLGVDQGYLCAKDRIICVQLKDGVPLWFLKLDSQVVGEIAMDENNIYAITSGGYLYSIAGRNGKINWKILIDSKTSTKNLIILSDTICVTSGSLLKVISLDTGRTLWQYDCGVTISAPVCSNGKILVSTEVGSVMCFSRDDTLAGSENPSSSETQLP